MKKIFTILICLSLMIGSIKAQTPNAFKYQAVVRDNAGQIIVNQNVGFRISILGNSASGNAVYSEKHVAQTNAFGLCNLEIGNGTNISGSFSAIDWGSSNYFVKIELDASNSGSFSEMGTSQLLAVPYSLYAQKADNGLNIAGTPQPGDILYNNGLSWGLLTKGVNGQTLRLDNGLPKWGEPGYALPMVTTSAVTDVLQTAAISGGNVIATGFTNITARGVCWGTNQNPTTADSKTSEAAGIGTFTSALTGLTANTTYYVRAYATNGAGTAYGNQVTFKTFLNVVFPTVTTNAVTNITANAVTSGGNVTATGGGEITERGVCWSDHQNPVITDNKTSDGNGTGLYQSQITGLTPGTYYARAYATNSAGTGYGNMVTFATEKILPTLTTKSISEISAMGAVSGGNITSTGGGTISDKGICWGENTNPTINDNIITSGSGHSGFTSAINTARPSTNYYVRAYAKNEVGINYGEEKTFKSSDAAYFQSFETGILPVNWGGLWSVNNTNYFDGSYSLRAIPGQVDSYATLTVTLANDGQIIFNYFYGGAYKFEFYIDDVLTLNLPNSANWNQVVINVTSGKHTFKWRYWGNTWGAIGYIDYVVIR